MTYFSIGITKFLVISEVDLRVYQSHFIMSIAHWIDESEMDGYLCQLHR